MYGYVSPLYAYSFVRMLFKKKISMNGPKQVILIEFKCILLFKEHIRYALGNGLYMRASMQYIGATQVCL